MFVDHQILILEWFVKDHVTLKTGVMMINYTLLYIQIENRWFTLIIFHCFTVNAALSRRDSQKH